MSLLNNLLKSKRAESPEGGASRSKRILKVSKYEDPQIALALISDILQPKAQLSESSFFATTYKCLQDLEEIAKEYDSSAEWMAEVHQAVELCKEQVIDALGEPPLRIAVAGGYSAGKSSLLNAILGMGDKLPTGIDPVSIVNTFINCKGAGEGLSVVGKNCKHALVSLPEEVLESIKHTKESKVYIAQALEQLMINVSTPNYLQGITFVDTPGYNNSSMTNAENSRSDHDTARDGLKTADLVLWCIDIEAGTIKKEDLDVMKSIGDKPLGIIFTKMDKKSEEEQTKILSAAHQLVAQHLSRQPEFIMAISAANPEKPQCRTLSEQGISFEKTIIPVLQSIKPEAVYNVLERKVMEDVKEWLIDSLASGVEGAKKELQRRREHGKELFKDVRQEEERLKRLQKEIKGVLGVSYDELDRLSDVAIERIKAYDDLLVNAINREYDWEGKVGMFSDASSLVRARDKDRNKLDKLQERELPKVTHYYDKELRSTLIEVITAELDELIQQASAVETQQEEGEEDVLKAVKWRTELLQKAEALYQALPTVLRRDYDEMLKFFTDMVQANQIEQAKTKFAGDVFAAIAEDNWLAFRSFVGDGVDLLACNAEGYNVLTWAARHGNNQIVAFFISQGVKLSQADDKGRTALSVAVQQHYQDICELLLEREPSLVQGLDLVALSRENQFEAYLKTLQ